MTRLNERELKLETLLSEDCRISADITSKFIEVIAFTQVYLHDPILAYSKNNGIPSFI